MYTLKHKSKATHTHNEILNLGINDFPSRFFPSFRWISGMGTNLDDPPPPGFRPTCTRMRGGNRPPLRLPCVSTWKRL